MIYKKIQLDLIAFNRYNQQRFIHEKSKKITQRKNMKRKNKDTKDIDMANS